jgi:hypothetical protein
MLHLKYVVVELTCFETWRTNASVLAFVTK